MTAVPTAALLDPVIVEMVPVVASVVRLEPGLFAVDVANATEPPSPPLIWLGQFAPESGERLAVLSTQGSGAQWLGASRTRLAIRVPTAGQLFGAMSFGSSAAPRIAIRLLDSVLPTRAMPIEAQAPVAASSESTTFPPLERDIRTEVTAHIERIGDRVFAGSMWAGTPGQQRRVEGFSIRPLQAIQPFEIEYKGLHPGGVETPWVRGTQFCGTRGRALPLTGFAVRIAPHVQDQYSVIYRAAFFRGGITEPRSNGAPCLSGIDGDVIEGISIRIVRRRSG